MSFKKAKVATLPKQREGFASNGDLRIHYRAYGSGPLVIFQHGFPDNEGTYAAQVAEFARDHVVVTPPLRSYPPSSVADEKESLNGTPSMSREQQE
jgi:pimeloyl-ACP methyl ester carboxylesterase